MSAPNKTNGADLFAQRLAQSLKTLRPKTIPKPFPAPPSSEAVPLSDSFSRRLNDMIAGTGPASLGTAGDDASSVAEAPAPADEAPVINGRGPVGAGEYTVRAGDCMSSIARDTGHFWETLWNDAGNSELREVRRNPNVLLAGDRVHVPPLRERWESGQTEVRHRFRRKGWPEVLKIRVLRDDDARANEPYTLDVDGEKFEGTTDREGYLSCPVVPNARRALLSVGGPNDQQELELQLGEIDPIDEITGVQQRLTNLGFDCGANDGNYGPLTEAALRKFQRRHNLPVTGEPDEATRKQLQSDYGC